MPSPGEKSPGRVCLVGAGPGDPGLITARGLARLREAEVVVYDALVDPTILAHAPRGAELVDAGKRARDHKLTQDQINQLLLEKARAGLRVVRLKGGDPYLFGRGAEEAAFLGAHGIEVEVVPGVTAGIAAPAAAGIPVTHRRLASTVTFVTGHEDPSKTDTAIDYAALARLIAAGGTVCFYMGVARLAEITGKLIEQRLAADTPAAVVQWGATPRQKSVRSTLAKLPGDAATLAAPAIIVVGAVVGIDEPGLDHFTSRPLFGQRVLITRTRHQMSELREKLAESGAFVLEAPTIELAPPSVDELAAIDQAIRDIRQFDWLVLTSTNAVQALGDRMERLAFDSRHLAGVKVAAIGDATAEELLSRLSVRADLVPTQFVAESLAGELIAKQDVRGKRFLLLRADIARPALPKLLTEAGAAVTELVVYQTRRASALPEEILAALREQQVDWVTFTSSSTATNLIELLGPEKHLLSGVKVASIGPITTETIRSLGLSPTVEASQSTIHGLVAAITACNAVSRP